VNQITREDVESDLHFLGLVILQNKLKQCTTKIIRELQLAEIRTLMATGDNLLTAFAVGKKCGIVDPDLPAYLGDLKEVNGKTRLHWTKIAASSEQGLNLALDSQGTQFENVSKIERMLPWEFEDEEVPEYTLAITGKALNFLI
jgi:magnesium-transporting ATPase (P-type)